MYTSSAENGIQKEGRLSRKGGSMMEISAWTSFWKVSNEHWNNISVPEIPFPIQQVQYDVTTSTFAPHAVLGDIKRFETLAWWLFTVQEEWRHLGLAPLFINSEYWPHMLEVRDAGWADIVQIVIDYLNDIIQIGDFSLEQFRKYVDDHGDSAAPFEEYGKWNEILANERSLRSCHAVVTKWIYDFVDYFKKFKCLATVPRLLKADLTYPSVRARPADYQVQSLNPTTLSVHCTKWRDRKVGGVLGLSQLTYPIYHNDAHGTVQKNFTARLSKFCGITIVSLEAVGPLIFKMMSEEKTLFCYDMKTAEKQTGLMLSGLGFAVDLSDSRFPAEHGAEMYSGIGPTGPLNELQAAIFLRALIDKGWSCPRVYIYSDNLATVVQLPPQVHYESVTTFCGYHPELRRFYPISLMTDNPKHRQQLRIPSSQSQRIQYIMKPLLSVIMNSVAKPTECYDFIEYVIANKIVTPSNAEYFRQDNVRDIILSMKPEVHAAIIDKFTASVAFVKNFYFVQDTVPDYSDLRIYPGVTPDSIPMSKTGLVTKH